MSDINAKFDALADLAHQAREIHLALDPQGWRPTAAEIANDLAGLRRQLAAGLGQAVHARSSGNRTLAEQLEAQAAASIAAALPLWRARLAAAEAERDRVRACTPKENPVARRAAMMGAHPTPPAQPIYDAARELARRVIDLADAAAHGRFDDNALISTTLAGMDQASAEFRSAVVKARLAARLRIAADTAATIIPDLKAA